MESDVAQWVMIVAIAIGAYRGLSADEDRIKDLENRVSEFEG